jgi:hypothetical protein
MQKACPSTEELAAFVDRRVSARAREELILHLADCEACTEVVAQTVIANAISTGNAVKAGRRWPARSSRLLAVAAAFTLLLLGVALYRARRSPAAESPSQLAALLAVHQGLSSRPWRGSVLRGMSPGDPGECAAFRLGVLLVDTHLAAFQGDAENMRLAASNVADQLDKAGFMAEEAGAFRRAAGATQGSSSLRPLAEQLDDSERRVRLRFSDTALEFGSFAEAGRLATLVEDQDFLTRAPNRRLLDRVRASSLPLTADATHALGEIRAALLLRQTPLGLVHSFERLMASCEE